jgi:hypothetical protein
LVADLISAIVMSALDAADGGRNREIGSGIVTADIMDVASWLRIQLGSPFFLRNSSENSMATWSVDPVLMLASALAELFPFFH